MSPGGSEDLVCGVTGMHPGSWVWAQRFKHHKRAHTHTHTHTHMPSESPLMIASNPNVNVSSDTQPLRPRLNQNEDKTQCDPDPIEIWKKVQPTKVKVSGPGFLDPVLHAQLTGVQVRRPGGEGYEAVRREKCGPGMVGV